MWLSCSRGTEGWPSKIAGYKNQRDHAKGMANVKSMIDNSSAEIKLINKTTIPIRYQDGLEWCDLPPGMGVQFQMIREVVVYINGKHAFLRNRFGTVSIENDQLFQVNFIIKVNGHNNFEIIEIQPVTVTTTPTNPVSTTGSTRIITPPTQPPVTPPVQPTSTQTNGQNLGNGLQRIYPNRVTRPSNGSTTIASTPVATTSTTASTSTASTSTASTSTASTSTASTSTASTSTASTSTASTSTASTPAASTPTASTPAASTPATSTAPTRSAPRSILLNVLGKSNKYNPRKPNIKPSPPLDPRPPFEKLPPGNYQFDPLAYPGGQMISVIDLDLYNPITQRMGRMVGQMNIITGEFVQLGSTLNYKYDTPTIPPNLNSINGATVPSV